LLFDGEGRLCGRKEDDSPREEGLTRNGTVALAFDGIHVVSPAIFEMMKEEGAFSIIATYLRLAAQGEKILGFRTDGYYWRDAGKREELEQIAAELAWLGMP
jgi:NDP-sugar pyrophosphorylase family protein